VGCLAWARQAFGAPGRSHRGPSRSRLRLRARLEAPEPAAKGRFRGAAALRSVRRARARPPVLPFLTCRQARPGPAQKRALYGNYQLVPKPYWTPNSIMKRQTENTSETGFASTKTTIDPTTLHHFLRSVCWTARGRYQF